MSWELSTNLNYTYFTNTVDDDLSIRYPGKDLFYRESANAIDIVFKFDRSTMIQMQKSDITSPVFADNTALIDWLDDNTGGDVQFGFTNGSLDVILNDATTPPFDLFFTQALAPPTTTTVEAVIGEYTITVDNPAIFTVGNLVGLFTGGTLASRYYWANLLDITGSVLTFDSPIDYPFEIDSTVLPTNRNMAVDGSVTPQVFSIQTGSSGLRIDVTRVMIALKTLTPPAQGDFGDVPELTRGVVLRKTDGENRNYWNVKSNFGLAVLTGTDTKIYEEIKTNDINAVVARWTLGGQDKHGVVIRIDENDSLDIVIQDDLTGLIDFAVIASGSEVTSN